MSWGLLDSCGILSVFAVPSILGAFSSSMILVTYFYHGFEQRLIGLSSQNSVFSSSRDMSQRGGYQSGALFLSMGAGVFSGLVAGFIIALDYKYNPGHFYTDEWHFDIEPQQEEKVFYQV